MERHELALSVLLVNGVTDDLRGVLVEVVEGDSRDDASDARREGLASITDEVLDLEQLLAGVLASLIELESPSVSQLKVEPSMIAGFDLDHIGHEVGTQEHGQVVDHVFSLRQASRE